MTDAVLRVILGLLLVAIGGGALLVNRRFGDRLIRGAGAAWLLVLCGIASLVSLANKTLATAIAAVSVVAYVVAAEIAQRRQLGVERKERSKADSAERIPREPRASLSNWRVVLSIAGYFAGAVTVSLLVKSWVAAIVLTITTFAFASWLVPRAVPADHTED